MHSSLIGKVEKAKLYAGERHRIHVDALSVTFHGENQDHAVRIDDDRLTCDCDFYRDWSVCSHTMALERMLDGLVPKQPMPV